MYHWYENSKIKQDKKESVTAQPAQPPKRKLVSLWAGASRSEFTMSCWIILHPQYYIKLIHDELKMRLQAIESYRATAEICLPVVADSALGSSMHMKDQGLGLSDCAEADADALTGETQADSGNDCNPGDESQLASSEAADSTTTNLFMVKVRFALFYQAFILNPLGPTNMSLESIEMSISILVRELMLLQQAEQATNLICSKMLRIHHNWLGQQAKVISITSGLLI